LPVCDKGGECPLQDQTMAYGPGESRFIEEKRHFEKPIRSATWSISTASGASSAIDAPASPKKVAGDPLIHFMNRGNETQVNTFPDDPFASYFSGNTVQICPVGALTAKPYRFKARRGISKRSTPPHGRLRRLAHHGPVVAQRRVCATSASTTMRSTGDGCPTKSGSASKRSTATLV
jgi:predicted molibdopterin-dependent oxidoreductase YjgC